MRAPRSRRRGPWPVRCRAWVVAGAGLAAWIGVAAANGPKFYPDDPIALDVDSEDASRVAESPLSSAWELAELQFDAPGDPTPAVRARNLNTIDEVPDSSWYTNRMSPRPAVLAELTTLMRHPGPADGPWLIVSSKSDGVSPGFTIQDQDGTVWYLKFDALGHPEMASGAEVVASRLLRILGYHVPGNHVAYMQPEQIAIDPSALYTPYLAKPRPMRPDDVARLLRGAARSADGSYRVLASRELPGRRVGGFRFHGTRPDDPNDVVPHEHRRELRALGVFAAWINYVDARGANTLDTVIETRGRHAVRHNLLDFGSTFGSAAIKPRPYWEGHAFAFSGAGDLLRKISTFGLMAPAFRDIPVHEHPSLGRLQALDAAWDPREWKPRAPNPAFERMRPDDAFWAARRVAAFTDEMLRAVVDEGRYSDPAAAEYLAAWLMRRRDAIARTYLPAVNPVVDLQLGDESGLTFANAAVAAGVARAPEGYQAEWSRFDNAAHAATPMGTTRATSLALAAPSSLPAHKGAFVQVSLKAVGSDHAAWSQPLRAWFRRDDAGWTLVGLERMS